jgi:hypothetical protein
MLAGRPHEAAGNGSPRWMTAAPRKRAHRTRPTGRLTPVFGIGKQVPVRVHGVHDREFAAEHQGGEPEQRTAPVWTYPVVAGKARETVPKRN